MQIHAVISLILAILVCGLAMWRGDRSARWIGTAFLADWLGSLLVYRPHVQSADYGVLMIDIVTLAAFVWISMRTRRLWTIVASAFMAIIVASHVAVMIDLRVTINTLKASMAIWSYGVLACIAFGTWAGWRRQGHAPS
ncbi:hypothetical protein [Caulobacter sp. UNC358MFTsu5.1]|uniref:hypothetical protein n=1 Tax=Caulobacter sp. UNC358MFTsu5.1 TaxID=1449049 RepID=UPI0004A70CD2|nr:hypothetical protein [Caulobacter sp. UNC358MFTsu5.1]